MGKLKFRVIIKFTTKHKTDEFYPWQSTVHKQHTLYKKDRESIVDDFRSGQPVESLTQTYLKNVLKDARFTEKQFEEIVCVSAKTVSNIFHQHLRMSKVSAIWSPKFPHCFRIKSSSNVEMSFSRRMSLLEFHPRDICCCVLALILKRARLMYVYTIRQLNVWQR